MGYTHDHTQDLILNCSDLKLYVVDVNIHKHPNKELVLATKLVIHQTTKRSLEVGLGAPLRNSLHFDKGHGLQLHLQTMPPIDFLSLFSKSFFL